MSVRIIGGKYRRKQIPVLDSAGLRPTGDRIRETLFNWLMHDVQGAHCLDLFAGSGALGLEAYSRGAKSVVFVEKNKKVFLQLQKTVLSFNTPACLRALLCLHQEALTYLKTAQETFDIIFLDPPFDSDLLQVTLEGLLTASVLKKNTLVYIESDADLDLSTHWKCVKSGCSGRIYYGLYCLS